MKKNILITGGAGFIGSHVVRLFVNKYPDYRIVNLDKLTYAGNLENLRDVENAPNYTFVKEDICRYEKMQEIFRTYSIDGVIHLAAESHVDRSIKDPFTFAKTNVLGTLSPRVSIGTAIMTAGVFTTFRPTKFTARWDSTGRCSPKRPSTTRTVPIRLRRRAAIISCGRFTILTDCLP